MKSLIYGLLFLSAFSACHSNKGSVLQRQVDSLEKQLSKTYKPGFGEFMSAIQVHHAKLWFAGRHQNWRLADFEIHEIMESLDNIKTIETERKESKLIAMLDTPVDSLNKAIERKDPKAFTNGFIFLTETCNNCHKAVDFDFNVVTIPASIPFTNQDFAVQPSGK